MKEITGGSFLFFEERPSLVNRKGVIIHHDNIRPYIAQLTKDLFKEPSWIKCFILHILLTVLFLIIYFFRWSQIHLD